jgi:hypothetical protein
VPSLTEIGAGFASRQTRGDGYAWRSRRSGRSWHHPLTAAITPHLRHSRRRPTPGTRPPLAAAASPTRRSFIVRNDMPPFNLGSSQSAFGIGRPTSDLQPRPRGAGVSSWSPGRCDAAIDGFFGSTAIRLNCATAVPGIRAACIPDSVLIAASESPPLPPGARSAGQTLTPSDGSVPRPSAGASRVDSRLAGAHALRYRRETGIARRSGRRASRLPRRPSGTEPAAVSSSSETETTRTRAPHALRGLLGSVRWWFRIETALVARAGRPERTCGAHGRETQANSRAKLPPVADDE